MKFFSDWIPIIVFFVSFKLSDIYVATGLAIITTILMMILLKIFKKNIEKMQWVSLGLIVIFGGATIVLQDEQFIKLKPTLLYVLFSLALVLPHFFGKILIKSLMEKHISLPHKIWAKLNLLWASFFAFLAILNFWVANNFTTDFWVEFKLFGMLGLTIAFTLLQALWLSKYKVEENKK